MYNEEPYAVGRKSYTAVAISTAARAGEWIKSRLGQVEKLQTKASAADLVTEVDKGAETMIRNLIHTHFPEHAFLGEESSEPGSASFMREMEQAESEEYLWIVDPIDGTTNFVHGFPFFSVSIALAHRGELIVGVVYDPSRDELFVAEKGKGAYLRGKRLKVSEEERLADSLLISGFPADRSYALPMNMRGVQALVPRVRNVRAVGSAALSLAYVAAGRATGFWETGLKAWDMSAGVLLVQEAGGVVSGMNGAPYSLQTRNVLASNGRIHQEFVSVLAEHEANGD